MDQQGNNHLLLRASQPATPVFNGQHAAADRMRELLARTVHDHLVEERSVAGLLQEIRLRLDTIDQPNGSGLSATIDGLAATLGALDSKLTARLERLDERLDDQYDRARSIDGKLDAQAAGMEERWPGRSAPRQGTSWRASRHSKTPCWRSRRRCCAPRFAFPQPVHASHNGRNLQTGSSRTGS